MFAAAPIKEGDVVFRWGGTFVTGKELSSIDRTGKIIIPVDDDLWSIEDRSMPEDDTYFINHFCDANVWMADARTFVAKRVIIPGEELTVDYALFETEEYVATWTCRCGSPFCRWHITGKDYCLPAVYARYAGHFSSLIEKKMKKKKL